LCNLFLAVAEEHGYIPSVAHSVTQGMLFYRARLFDLVITDYQLPDGTGIDVVKTLQEEDPLLPVLLITGRGDERIAAEAFRLGATNYLIKDGQEVFLEMLPDAIDRALQHAGDRRAKIQSDEALRISEERFRDFCEVSSDWYWELDENLRYTLLVASSAKKLAGNPDDWIGKLRSSMRPENLSEDLWQAHMEDLEARRPFQNFIQPRLDEAGNICWLSVSGKPVFGEDGMFSGYRGTATDVTQARQAELKLRDAHDELERRVAERTAQLSASEARLADILNLAPEAIINFDEQLNIRFFNQGAERAFGYESSEIIGQHLHRLIPERLQDQHQINVHEFSISNDRTRRTGVRSDIYGRRKDGSEFPANIAISKVETDTGNLYTVILQDISAYQKEERARKTAEQRFRAIVDHSPSPIVLKDRLGRYVITNEKWNEWFNPNRQNPIGKTSHEFCSQEIAAKVVAMEQRVFETGRSYATELEYLNDEGREVVFILQQFPVLDEQGEVVASGGVVTDVSHHKIIENRLIHHSRSLEMLGKIAIASNSAATVTDALQVAIDEICKFTGWPAARAFVIAEIDAGRIGKSDIWHLPTKGQAQKFRDLIDQHHITFGEGLAGRIWQTGKAEWIGVDEVAREFRPADDGDNQIIKAACGLPVTVGTEVVAVLQFFMDKEEPKNPELLDLAFQIASQLGRVIERHVAQNKINDALAFAEKANQSKTEFLANMSHELRTPLNAIMGFAQMMQIEVLGPLSQEIYKDYLANIYGSGEQLLGIINEILDVARIEAGEIELQDDVIDIIETLEFCRTSLVHRINGSGITVEIHESPDLPKLRADKTRIRQIISNLITNSVKYNNPDGRVDIYAGIGEDGRVEVAVVDTGIGIAEKNIDRVQKRFEQVEASHVRKGDGIGLGLPIVKLLSELHGAEFRLHSTVGSGTTATVVFPLERII